MKTIILFLFLITACSTPVVGDKASYEEGEIRFYHSIDLNKYDLFLLGFSVTKKKCKTNCIKYSWGLKLQEGTNKVPVKKPFIIYKDYKVGAVEENFSKLEKGHYSLFGHLRLEEKGTGKLASGQVIAILFEVTTDRDGKIVKVKEFSHYVE